MDTKTNHFYSDVFLTGCILLAGIDVLGLVDYALKAVVGGAIWFGYRYTADYLARKKEKKV